jgi:hypothetical protein
MNACQHAKCTPFDPCVLTAKERARAVCQYAEPGRIMARKIKKDNEMWANTMSRKQGEGRE